jgi:crotonobetainyl-CoA:carnitine CoA-transferase CaiB-like acyl-CoA transferase
MVQAFDNIRILDFSQGIAGPMACMLLADFGAEVIKIEPPGGDRMKAEPGYHTWNRNKRRVVLDLHRFEGLRATRELLATADVAVFDWRPGEMERSGLDAVTVRAAHPALLHAWLPPYSPTGRWSQLAPDDLLLSALGSVSHLQYSYEEWPTHLVTPQVTYAHAMLSAGAIASGLYERAQSGQGQALTVSGLHAVASVESGGTIRSDGMFRMAGRTSRGGVPNYRLYQCEDGLWLFLGTLTPQFFLMALGAMDLTDLMAIEGVDGELTNLWKPPFNAMAIDALDRRFAEKPREEWLAILHEAGVPRAPAGTREEWFDSETVSANEMRIALQHQKLGKIEMPGVPVKLSETPGSVRHLLEDTKLEALPEHSPSQIGSGSLSVGTAKRGPLAGVRVLDLGAFIAGTFAPTILSSWGANVIKVEGLDGDPFRTYGLTFAGHNRGKRGLAVDLKSPEGHEAFMDLVRVSDVVLDNYRMGVRERLGIDYEALRKVNPRIISCSVTGYGTSGPLSGDPGFDPLVQARSGLMSSQGGDDEPVFYQIAINDSASAMMAAFGVVTALFAREHTGRGQDVQTCLANQSVLCQSGELTWFEGRPPVATGGRDCLGTSALRRFYECGDGWIGIACTATEQFGQLAAALGHTEWAGRMTAEQALVEPVQSPLAELIAAALVAMPRDEALDRLLTRGVPAAPAFTVSEFFEEAWAHENAYFDDYEHPQFGTIRGPHAFATWGTTASGFERRAPLLGEHSAEVLRDCGFDEERVAKLVESGVVRQAS